ncbi:MAG: hypothetical protein C4329_14730 [Chitinophagaceae bacterium]
MGSIIRIASRWLALVAIVFTALNVQADAPNPINLSTQTDRLQKALIRYYNIESSGGWTKINATQKYYLKGQSNPTIVQTNNS